MYIKHSLTNSRGLSTKHWKLPRLQKKNRAKEAENQFNNFTQNSEDASNNRLRVKVSSYGNGSRPSSLSAILVEFLMPHSTPKIFQAVFSILEILLV